MHTHPNRAHFRFVSKQFGVSLAATDVLVEQQPRREPGKSKFTTRTGGSLDVRSFEAEADGSTMEVDVSNDIAVGGVFGTAAGAPTASGGAGWA